MQILGPDHALNLCAKVFDIEDVGGLMTKDGQRRRTLGGVFFHLLRTDPHISKDCIEQIFDNTPLAINKKKKRKKPKSRGKSCKKY